MPRQWRLCDAEGQYRSRECVLSESSFVAKVCTPVQVLHGTGTHGQRKHTVPLYLPCRTKRAAVGELQLILVLKHVPILLAKWYL